jgi:hypothetical protein
MNKTKPIEFKCSNCNYLLYLTYKQVKLGIEVFTPKCTQCGHQDQAEDIINQKEEEWYEQQGFTEAEYYEREMLLEKQRNPNREMSEIEKERLKELNAKTNIDHEDLTSNAKLLNK